MDFIFIGQLVIATVLVLIVFVVILFWRGVFLSVFICTLVGTKKEKGEMLFNPWDFISKKKFIKRRNGMLRYGVTHKIEWQIEEDKKIRIRLERCRKEMRETDDEKKSSGCLKTLLSDQILRRDDLIKFSQQPVLKFETGIDSYLLVPHFFLFEILDKFSNSDLKDSRIRATKIIGKIDQTPTYKYIGDGIYFGPFINWLFENGYISAGYLEGGARKAYIDYFFNLDKYNRHDSMKPSKARTYYARFNRAVPKEIRDLANSHKI